MPPPKVSCIFFFNDTATTEIYTLSLHDALPISHVPRPRDIDLWRLDLRRLLHGRQRRGKLVVLRSEEHTSELQSPDHLVCRLLLEKKKNGSAPCSIPAVRRCRHQRRQACLRSPS